MTAALRYFIGEATLTFTGASMETLLNALTKNKVRFWRIEPVDEIHFSLCVAPRDSLRAEKIAVSCFCNLESIQINGFAVHFRALLKRPALMLGMLTVIFLSFYLQNRVLAIDISGNETLHDEQIVRALEENGIKIGSSSSEIDQQLTKHRMLNTIPELSWIGVNRTGFRLNVLVTERSFAKSNRPQYRFANIVSARDATITKQSILEGMRLCQVGDTVKQGQILVSGFEDYGLILRGVCAEGEIYGQTWYDGVVVTPSHRAQKRFTGRTWTQYSLLVGRKRINLCGNSSILGTSCDKMVETFSLSLPGYEFPLRLEKITYREYQTDEIEIEDPVAREQLLSAWREGLLSQMIAGTIEETQASLSKNADVYALSCKSTCNEMIGRLVPMESVFEGETNE